jgi:predicted Fe-Mo cluster-binding NifX family protein
MKIAVSAQRDDIGALVDPRFGRAAWFILADTAADEWTTQDNRENANGSGGGVSVAAQLAAQGVGAVITGNIGPSAGKRLRSAGVRILQASNGVTVRDALIALQEGSLPSLDAPTIAGPWS